MTGEHITLALSALLHRDPAWPNAWLAICIYCDTMQQSSLLIDDILLIAHQHSISAVQTLQPLLKNICHALPQHARWEDIRFTPLSSVIDRVFYLSTTLLNVHR